MTILSSIACDVFTHDASLDVSFEVLLSGWGAFDFYYEGFVDFMLNVYRLLFINIYFGILNTDGR